MYKELEEYYSNLHNSGEPGFKGLYEERGTELCDTCLTQQEEVRLSPDECGFVCVNCIGRTFEFSYAVKKFREITSHTEIELMDWFEGLKIVK